MSTIIEITVCMGSACYARGNEQNLKFVESFIKENKLEAKIDIGGSRCEGMCADGPNIIINGTEYNKVNIKKLKEILIEMSKNKDE